MLMRITQNQIKSSVVVIKWKCGGSDDVEQVIEMRLGVESEYDFWEKHQAFICDG